MTTIVALTAPDKEISRRRGDPLGLRPLGDFFADKLVPDLSSRTTDARWFTILCWCLKRSHDVFQTVRDPAATSLQDRREQYEWLRPLELMWVQRTVWLSGNTARQYGLAGAKGLRYLYDNERTADDQFGQSPEQLENFRTRGIFARYARALRVLPRMTTSGGWAPGERGAKLALWLDRRLANTAAALPSDIAAGAAGNPRTFLGGRRQAEYWLRRWPQWTAKGPTEFHGSRQLLPRQWDDHHPLDKEEQALLLPALFEEGDGAPRRAAVAAACAGNGSHLDACIRVAQKLANESDGAEVSALPCFSRLADEATNVVDLMWRTVAAEGRRSFTQLASEIDPSRLADAGKQWFGNNVYVPDRENADRLAEGVRNSSSNAGVLRAIAHHHQNFAGGDRWFHATGSGIELRAAPSQARTPFIRFRLFALGRMAVQVGKLKSAPKAVLDDRGAAFDEDEEEGN